MDFQPIIEKTKKEWKEDPQKSEDESKVISKYGNMFNPKNIDNLTKENFKSFLKSENNKHWRHLERKGPEIAGDLEKLKNTLKILLDESIPIQERIQRIRDKNSHEYHKGLGPAYYTPILLVVYPKKYPVINKVVKEALRKTAIYPDYDSKPEWIAYSQVFPKILQIAEKNHLSLWQMDAVWQSYLHESNSVTLRNRNLANEKEFGVFLTGYSQENLQLSKTKNILGWKQNSKRKELSNGDFVFVYNIEDKKIDCLFEINSRIQTNDLLWIDEVESKTIIYKNRWKANFLNSIWKGKKVI